MKKTMSFIISIALMISMTITGFANESAEKNPCTTEVMEEVSIISALQSLTDIQLHDKGFSEDEIYQIRTFDYEKELSKRAALNDETLLIYGYSKSEINELRKYVNSNGAKGSISPTTMTTSLSLTNKTVNANYRKATFKLTWRWNRLPLIKLFDTVGAVWTSLEGAHFISLPNGTNSVKLVLTKINPAVSGPDTRNYYQTWSTKTFRSIESKFGLTDGAYFAMSGEGIFQMESPSGTGRLYIEAGYAHLTLGITAPSVSIGSDRSFGISLTFTLVNDLQIRKQLYNSNLTLYQTYA